MTAFAQAWRALARRRAFTLVTILTLAAGAGVTTTGVFDRRGGAVAASAVS
jgi:hypothetical protein